MYENKYDAFVAKYNHADDGNASLDYRDYHEALKGVVIMIKTIGYFIFAFVYYILQTLPVDEKGYSVS